MKRHSFNSALTRTVCAGVAAVMAAATAMAATEVVDGIEWTYTISDGNASVGADASSSAVPASTSGAITVPSTLGGCPVTGIMNYAFWSCRGLTSVTITNSVTNISNYAFTSCRNLMSVTIPDSVTSIGDYAFWDCSRLTSMTLPDAVTSIGDKAFWGCRSLTSVTVPDSVTSIGEEAFYGCRSLTSVTIPDSVTSIGEGAFDSCSGLSTLYLPGRFQGQTEGMGIPVGCKVVFSTAPTYTIVFSANGGIGDMAEQTVQCDTDTALSDNAFTRAGYSFSGWAMTSTGAVSYADGAIVRNLAAASKTATLYAKWTGNNYTVTLDSQGGSGGTDSVSATYGSSMPGITPPTRTDYVFGGYYTEPNGVGTQYYMADGASARDWDKTSATTLYAKWTENALVTYTITYKPGENGTGAEQTATKTNDVALTLMGAVFTRAGYMQTGWATSDGGTKAYDLSAAYTANAAATLYPCWTANTFAVPLPVFRFYSKAYKGHFFTISEEEKDELIAHNPNWKFEGTAYRAYTNEASGTVALYRFYSKGYRGHFFTIDADEAETVKTNPNWKYEGIAYYVYPSAVEGSVPVFRFWSKGYRHHFYTTDEAEKDNLIANNPNWKYEGEAFWALPAEETRSAAKAAAMSNDRNDGNNDGNDGNDEIAINAINAISATSAINGDANGFSSSICASPEVGVGVGPWALATWPDCELVALEGVTEVGGLVVETRTDAPELEDLPGGDGSTSRPLALPLLLALPDGAWRATLRSALDDLVSDENATGVFGFTLPANGLWHWLRVRDAEDDDADGNDAFSLWLRAE